MNKSEQINELAAALSKAQGEIGGAIVDSKNPYFNSEYASLESVINVSKEPLAKNGLSITQIPSNEGTKVKLETVMMHSSGQWISGNLEMQPDKQTPQGIGSCISYARRYALSAFLGIYEKDDDGNAAEKEKPGNEQKQPATQSKPQGPSPSIQPHHGPSEAQLKRLFAIMKTGNWTEEQVKTYMKTTMNGISSRSQLTGTQYQMLCSIIEKHSYAEALRMYAKTNQAPPEVPKEPTDEDFDSFMNQ